MHSQTIFALLASVATLASSSPLVQRATCPPADDNHSPLVSQGLDGNFVVCNYEDAGRCTYFTNGSFDSGSSVCPDQILDDVTATCPETDDTGSALLSSSASDSEVVCRYENAGVCTYFTNGGFSSGSSECPDSAIAKKVKAREAEVVEKRAAHCPAVDNNGSPLLSSGPASDPRNGIRCVYRQARVCIYFSNGSFSSGSSVCPTSIANNIKAREADVVSEVVEKRAASCPAVDNNGSPLLSSGPASDPRNGIRCVYRQARTCIYFSNGSFSSGSSVCPTSIANKLKVREADAVPEVVEARAPRCPAVDNNGSPLLSSRRVSDPRNGIRCVYRQARFCTYFANGSFSSGSSVCPTSI